MLILSRNRLIIERNGRKFGVLQCTRFTTVHICRVLLMPADFDFGLGSFSALCKNYNFTIFLKLGSSPNFHPIHPNFIQGIIIIQAVTFYGDLSKIAKIMALWNFLNTGPYAAGIFNFSHNFHWSLSKLCDNTGYHGKSECLLEYCNEKLASSTWGNIILFYLQLFKTILVYWVFSSSRASRPLGLLFGDLPKLKILCQNEFFLNTGPYGAGNFKTPLLQFSSDVNQTLWGHWLPWCYFSWQLAKF